MLQMCRKNVVDVDSESREAMHDVGIFEQRNVVSIVASV